MPESLTHRTIVFSERLYRESIFIIIHVFSNSSAPNNITLDIDLHCLLIGLH